MVPHRQGGRDAHRRPGTYQLVGRDDVAAGLRELITEDRRAATVTAASPRPVPIPKQVSTLSGWGSIEPTAPSAEAAGQVRGDVPAILLGRRLPAPPSPGGVVEEKSRRVVELLLATIPATHLLAGKIHQASLGLVGLLRLLILAGVGTAVALTTGLIAVPVLLVGALVIALVWYLVGFFLFATLYAAAGPWYCPGRRNCSR
ncbi:hypothetical protein HBB16_03200 [Pseudonocardia sp. MCCB 268]|nr:hypothetical protein [Pseudonocardia cytotoxica]